MDQKIRESFALCCVDLLYGAVTRGDEEIAPKNILPAHVDWYTRNST